MTSDGFRAEFLPLYRASVRYTVDIRELPEFLDTFITSDGAISDGDAVGQVEVLLCYDSIAANATYDLLPLFRLCLAPNFHARFSAGSRNQDASVCRDIEHLLQSEAPKWRSLLEHHTVRFELQIRRGHPQLVLALDSHYFQNEHSKFKAILAGTGQDAYAGVKARRKMRDAWEKELGICMSTLLHWMDILME